MKINILYFGLIAEAIKCTTEQLVLNTTMNVDQVNNELIQKHTVLKNLNYQIAVNKELVSRETNITTDCEIALLPPFAGG